MFGHTMRPIGTLVLIVVMMPLLVTAGESRSPGDLPEILWDPCGFTSNVRIGTVTDALPGHGYRVPLDLKLDAEETAIGFRVQIQSEKGLTVNSVITDNTDWQNIGTVGWSHNQDYTVHTFTITSGSMEGNDEYQRIFDLDISVDDTVTFSNGSANIKDLMLLTGLADEYPEITYQGGAEPCQATVLEHGSITIIIGLAWFDMGYDSAYSYQAQDSLSDASKKVFVLVPVLFKSNFPAKGINIGVEANSDYVDFVPDGSYSAGASWCDEENYKLSIHDGTSLFEASETYYHLGDLKFVGHDYHDAYMNSLMYTHQDQIHFYDCGSPCDDPRVRCDSSTTELSWDDITTSSGIIQYFQYRCETELENVYMPPNTSEIQMPVNADHTFWSQGFKYFFGINDDNFTSVDVSDNAGIGNRYQYVVRTDAGYYSGDKKIHKFITSDGQNHFQKGRYIPANSNEEIFRILLTPSSEFSDCVGCVDIIDIHWDAQNDEESYVCDFFHKHSPANEKIYRIYPDHGSYFTVIPGTVTTPKFRLDIDDDVICRNPTKVGVRVTEVATNTYDGVALGFTCSGPMVFTDVVDGNFDISWGDLEIDPTGKNLTVTGHIPNPVTSTGLLLTLVMQYAPSGSGATAVIFDRAVFYWSAGSSYHDVFTSDGSVLPCGWGKNEPCGDCPIPYTYFLDQSYPNPFNANTIIGFGLAEPGLVQLDVYDILGKRVRTLKSEEMDAGNYNATWDGTNDAGAEVGSGFYFYILKANDFIEKRRMTLLK